MANLDMSLFSSWYLVQHVSWKLDAIKRPQNCWTVSHVDKGPSVKSTRLVRLSSVVTEEWFSISSLVFNLSSLLSVNLCSACCPVLTQLERTCQLWPNFSRQMTIWRPIASCGWKAFLQIHVGRSCSSLEEAFGKSDMCFCAAAFLWKMKPNTQLNNR